MYITRDNSNNKKVPKYTHLCLLCSDDFNCSISYYTWNNSALPSGCVRLVPKLSDWGALGASCVPVI